MLVISACNLSTTQSIPGAEKPAPNSLLDFTTPRPPASHPAASRAGVVGHVERRSLRQAPLTCRPPRLGRRSDANRPPLLSTRQIPSRHLAGSPRHKSLLDTRRHHNSSELRCRTLERTLRSLIAIASVLRQATGRSAAETGSVAQSDGDSGQRERTPDATRATGTIIGSRLNPTKRPGSPLHGRCPPHECGGSAGIACRRVGYFVMPKLRD